MTFFSFYTGQHRFTRTVEEQIKHTLSAERCLDYSTIGKLWFSSIAIGEIAGKDSFTWLEQLVLLPAVRFGFRHFRSSCYNKWCSSWHWLSKALSYLIGSITFLMLQLLSMLDAKMSWIRWSAVSCLFFVNTIDEKSLSPVECGLKTLEELFVRLLLEFRSLLGNFQCQAVIVQSIDICVTGYYICALISRSLNSELSQTLCSKFVMSARFPTLFWTLSSHCRSYIQICTASFWLIRSSDIRTKSKRLGNWGDSLWPLHAKAHGDRSKNGIRAKSGFLRS